MTRPIQEIIRKYRDRLNRQVYPPVISHIDMEDLAALLDAASANTGGGESGVIEVLEAQNKRFADELEKMEDENTALKAQLEAMTKDRDAQIRYLEPLRLRLERADQRRAGNPLLDMAGYIIADRDTARQACQEAARERDGWVREYAAVSRALKCLPSYSVGCNDHVMKKAKELMQLAAKEQADG